MLQIQVQAFGEVGTLVFIQRIVYGPSHFICPPSYDIKRFK